MGYYSSNTELSRKLLWRFSIVYLIIMGTVCGECVFKINEVFVDTDIEENIAQDFLEIISDCTNDKIGSEEGLTLMVIGNENPTLNYYIEFKIRIYNSKQFFVIASDDIVSNIDLIVSPLPYESEYPSLILLFKTLPLVDKNVLDPNTLSGKPLTNMQKAIIINKSIDGFIICKNIFNIMEGMYTNIIPKWENMDYYVNYYSDKGIFQYQSSINRCSTGFFDIEFHQITQVTPGLENICMDDNIYDVQIDISKGLELLESNLDKDRQIIVKDSLENVPINDPIWPNTGNFKAEWFDLIKSRHPTNPNLLYLIVKEEFKESIVYLNNPENPMQSTLRCNSCYYMSKQANPLVTIGQEDICKESGQGFRSRARETRKKIEDHLQSSSHINVINALTCPPEKRIKLNEESTELKATANLFYWIYVETLAGVSYRAHDTLMIGIKKFGIEIGSHNDYRRRVPIITNFISDKMHENFIKYLVDSNAPFSLLMDASTDNFGLHGLLIYFQYIEKNRPILKLYKYIELKDSTAIGQFNTLIRAFSSESNPGFQNYVKNNLKAITVDGVNSNIGIYNSVWRHLESYINTGRIGGAWVRPLIYYHCSSHRLALAYNQVIFNKDPISELEYTKLLFKNANRLQKFYNTQSYKRRASLIEDAEEEDEKVRMFAKLFKVRWLPSSQVSYDIILINYKIFMRNLNDINLGVSKNKYPTSVKQEAEIIRMIFSHKNTLITYVYHLDILFTLTKFAKKLQKKAGTIIELKGWYEQMITELTKLKTINGPYLKQYLAICKCNKKQGCSTLGIFESEKEIEYKNVILHDTDIDDIFPKLSVSKVKIIEHLIEQLKTRFPDSSINAFSMFNPRDMSIMQATQLQYTLNHFKKYFNYNMQEMRNSLTTLFASITSSQFYKNHKNDPPEIFWPNALYNENFAWNDLLRNIIKIALVQSIGTSQVESGFSQLTYIKNKWRSRLTIKNVEAQLRIKFNGVGKNKLFEICFGDLARMWINEGHLRSDDTRRLSNQNKPHNRILLPSII